MSDFDTDGDGFVDQTGYDTDGDGVLDTWQLDTNEDGFVDQTAFDGNGDGVADTWGVDSNEDGVIDSVSFDTDGDGYADSSVLDANQNGINDASEGGDFTISGPGVDEPFPTDPAYDISGPGVTTPATGLDGSASSLPVSGPFGTSGVDVLGGYDPAATTLAPNGLSASDSDGGDYVDGAGRVGDVDETVTDPDGTTHF